MTKQVQRRRGTDTQHTGFTGAEGEISVNTTNKSVHVHDGSTAGGFEAARADLNNVTTANTASKLSGGTVSSLTVTSADINGGTIDGTTIGGSTPAAGSFTNVSVTGTVDGRDVATDGTKLDGIEASADVTDTANVTAAGALMDSELTDIASVKALDQGVATTDSPSFAGLTATTADINSGTIDGVTIGGASAGAGTFNALTVDGGTTNRVASFISTDANALIEFADDTTTNRPAIGAEGNDMTFSTNGEKVRIDADGNVGIGTSSPSEPLHVYGSTLQKILVQSTGSGAQLILQSDNGSTADIMFGDTGDVSRGLIRYDNANESMQFWGNNLNERMRIDSSGNLLINSGTNATPGVGDTDTGVSITETNAIFASRNQATGNSSATIFANRNTTDGGIITLYQNGNEIGEIGVDNGDLYIGTGSYGLAFRDGSADIRPFSTNTGGDTNGTTDLGGSGVRFREIFATNGTINVSDINEKQDIEELSEAEQRVAVAAKGLLRKFRWKDMVAEKGDDARIHFGIMAQDLQAAFEAEGLDAGRYSMFVKETYYELLIDVPAVEAQDAVLDDEGNIVTEAVEAKEAYTKRTVYKAHQEIPEGAKPVTTYGVRYSELLAFIIAAI